VALLSPDGGEFIPSGSIYKIEWKAPAEAATFKLKYSLNNGLTWLPIEGASGVQGISYDWAVPNIVQNKDKCLVRIIGYTANSDKVWNDISDAPFTIGVVNLTAASDPGITVTSGTTYDITWTAYTATPIETVQLYYTANAKAFPIKWKLITSFSGGYNPGTHTWTVPVVAKKKTKCKIKVVLKNAAGEKIGIDKSDNYFTVQPY
jgi:hypothetical protein